MKIWVLQDLKDTLNFMQFCHSVFISIFFTVLMLKFVFFLNKWEWLLSVCISPNKDRIVCVCVYVHISSGISHVSVCSSTGVIWGLAAHVGVFDLNSEQGPVCTHTQLIPLPPLVKIQLTPKRGVWNSGWTEHHRAIQDNAVLLQTKAKIDDRGYSMIDTGCVMKNRFSDTNQS